MESSERTSRPTAWLAQSTSQKLKKVPGTVPAVATQRFLRDKTVPDTFYAPSAVI